MDLSHILAHKIPESLIAQNPANPRDSARLLIYTSQTNQIHEDSFLHIDRYLPEKSFLVFNDTKVIPARIHLTKESGGRVELLLLLNERRDNDPYIRALSDRKLSMGQTLFADNKAFFDIAGQEEKVFLLKPRITFAHLMRFLYRSGTTPLPKYIRSSALGEKKLRQSYQSIFAHHPASVAAPTASLHFTNRVLRKLKERHIQHFFVTLHVGLGTFSPVTEENLKSNELFSEYRFIQQETAQKIQTLKNQGYSLIAVGTTATRALESSAKNGVLHGSSGPTNLFIHDPFPFQAVDGLITNFHLAHSSLLFLVDAFLKHKNSQTSLDTLYALAIKKHYRFYSFGDGMFVI